MSEREQVNLSRAMGDVLDALNPMGSEKAKAEASVAAFDRQHRTLQQCFMRSVVIPILKHLAKEYEEERCDGRNVHSGRLAYYMLKAVTEDDIYLPFI